MHETERHDGGTVQRNRSEQRRLGCERAGGGEGSQVHQADETAELTTYTALERAGWAWCLMGETDGKQGGAPEREKTTSGNWTHWSPVTITRSVADDGR